MNAEYSTEKAKKYHRIKLLISLTTSAIKFLILGAFFVLGYSSLLVNWITGISRNFFIINALYIIVLIIGGFILFLPVDLYKEYFMEHKYNVSNQSFFSFTKDIIKGLVLELVLSLIIIEIIYLFLAKFPDKWWWIISIFLILFSVVLAKIAPIIIIPIFYKQEPLNNPALEVRLSGLLSKYGINFMGFFRLILKDKTKKANGGLTGTGKTRRIVLSDTLLDNYSDEEIEAVIAHELGHHLHKHILKGIILSATIITFIMYICHIVLTNSFAFFRLNAISDIAGFPLFMLVSGLLVFLISPALNTISRIQEFQADKFALKATNNPTAFISMMQKLNMQNLGDKDPNAIIEFLFHSHPAVGKRIAVAEAWDK